MKRWTKGLAWAGLVVGLPLAVGIGNGALKVSRMHVEPRPVEPAAFPARPAHDPSKPTAVVLLGDHATEATDFLAPYEILSRSGAYNVYAVAGERRPQALLPGEIAVLPHLSLAEYDAAIGENPAVIVVPYMASHDDEEDPEMTAWIQTHWTGSTTLLSVCAGAYNLARMGIIEGRTATSHANYITMAREKGSYGVTWVNGQRWVDDGNYISSAGVTSGVDATLHLLGREQGAETAERVAREISYPHLRFQDDPTFAVPTGSPIPSYVGAAYSGSEDIGLVLYPGSNEIELAALTDAGPRAFMARLRTIAPEGGIVRTQHGLDIVTRWSYATAPALTRLFFAGRIDMMESGKLRTWSGRRGLTFEPTYGEGYTYDRALTDLARHTSGTAAVEAAKELEYPIDHLGIEAGSPLGAFHRPLGLALLGLLIGMTTMGGLRPALRFRRRSMAHVATLLIVAVAASGCYHATVRTATEPLTELDTSVQRIRGNTWAWGIISPKPIDGAARCGGTPAQVETEFSFMNQVVGFLTSGIYMPMTIKVTCVTP